MVRRLVLAVLVALPACGGGAKQAAEPVAPAPPCSAVADAMVGMMMEGKDASQIADTVDAFKTIIRTRCTDDAWTAAARECLAAMQTQGDAERCSTLLTDEQQANLVRDQRAKFGDGPGDETPPPEPSVGGAVPPPPPAATPAPATPSPEATPSPPKPSPKKRAAPRTPARTGDPCDGGE